METWGLCQGCVQSFAQNVGFLEKKITWKKWSLMLLKANWTCYSKPDIWRFYSFLCSVCVFVFALQSSVLALLIVKGKYNVKLRHVTRKFQITPLWYLYCWLWTELTNYCSVFWLWYVIKIPFKLGIEVNWS